MTDRLLLIGVLLLAASGLAAAADNDTHLPDRSEYRAPRAAIAPTVDGRGDDDAWQEAEWRELKWRWLGPEYDAQDFRGRYRIVWSEDRLYVLVEIVDDILFDSHRDPLVQYWDDDCLEIFLDEDFSGGDHQHNHNAFAYHLSLDNRAIDIGTDGAAREYTHHVDSAWRQYEEHLVWEVALDVYADDYVDGSDQNTPVKLFPGKVLGIMLAWCDNDGSELRENFVGSESVPFGPKDRGWIDAGLFGALILQP